MARSRSNAAAESRGKLSPMKVKGRSPIRHRRRPARTRCPGAGTRLDCLDRSGPTVRRRTSSRQARCSQAAGIIATRIKRQRSFRRSRRGRWRSLLRRGWRVHPIAGAVSPNPCSRRGAVRPNPMPTGSAPPVSNGWGRRCCNILVRDRVPQEDKARITPHAGARGTCRDFIFAPSPRIRGSLVQTTREMATTAANTAKRARIIDNVGDHR